MHRTIPRYFHTEFFITTSASRKFTPCCGEPEFDGEEPSNQGLSTAPDQTPKFSRIKELHRTDGVKSIQGQMNWGNTRSTAVRPWRCGYRRNIDIMRCGDVISPSNIEIASLCATSSSQVRDTY